MLCAQGFCVILLKLNLVPISLFGVQLVISGLRVERYHEDISDTFLQIPKFYLPAGYLGKPDPGNGAIVKSLLNN